MSDSGPDMSGTSGIPIIDISEFPWGGTSNADSAASAAARIGTAVDRALSESGFMYVTGHGLDPALLARAFAIAGQFFALPESQKKAFAYGSVDANFGFQGIEGESLDPTAKPDLKESFTMRNARAWAAQTDRWPDAEFRDMALELYDAALATAYRILAILAATLQLPTHFFAERHLGENVTLRFLHYPANLPQRSTDQLGAGAHTDYGSITLLFQDDVGGLEVLGADGVWRDAPPVTDAIMINTGDLMELWTHGRFRSTTHRVKPITGDRDRYSIAFFVDPDSAVMVEGVTAGEHIRRKIAATHG